MTKELRERLDLLMFFETSHRCDISQSALNLGISVPTYHLRRRKFPELFSDVNDIDDLVYENRQKRILSREGQKLVWNARYIRSLLKSVRQDGNLTIQLGSQNQTEFTFIQEVFPHHFLAKCVDWMRQSHDLWQMSGPNKINLEPNVFGEVAFSDFMDRGLLIRPIGSQFQTYMIGSYVSEANYVKNYQMFAMIDDQMLERWQPYDQILIEELFVKALVTRAPVFANVATTVSDLIAGGVFYVQFQIMVLPIFLEKDMHLAVFRDYDASLEFSNMDHPLLFKCREMPPQLCSKPNAATKNAMP